MRVGLVDWVFPGPLGVFTAMKARSILRSGHEVTIVSTQGRVGTTIEFPEVKALMDRTVFLDRPTGLNRVWALFLGAIRHPQMFRRVFSRSLHRAGLSTRGQMIHAAAALGDNQFVALRRCDVIHFQWGPLGQRFVYLGELLSRPTVVSFNGMGMWPDRDFMSNGSDALIARGYRNMISRADAFVAVSDFVKDRLVQLGFATEKIHVIPEGSDPSDFPFIERDYCGVSKWRFVSTGRLEAIKGFDVAIRALSMLPEDIPFEFLIIGDGSEKAKLQSLCFELGLQQSVRFLGQLNWREMNTVYSAAHAFIYSGRVLETGQAEAGGVTPREAALTGLPVISTRVGGVAENVVDGVTGLLVDPEDPVKLSAAVLSFVRTPAAALEQMSRRGCRYTIGKFDRTTCDGRLLDLYRTVVN